MYNKIITFVTASKVDGLERSNTSCDNMKLTNFKLKEMKCFLVTNLLQQLWHIYNKLVSLYL